MKVIFGGARGSSPVSGSQYEIYGGDTTSLLVLGDKGERIIIDAGTGLKNLLPHLGESGDPLVMLLSHYHLDHLMGLPSFPPLYQSGRSIKIVGLVPPSGRPDTWQAITTFMGEPYWPVPMAEAGSMLVTVDVSSKDGSWLGQLNQEFLTVGGLEVRVCPMPHPGGCLAWRIDDPANGSSFIFATDIEWSNAGPDQRQAFYDFCKKPRPVSTLIMDGHFAEKEYSNHMGWGHSTLQEVAQAGVEAGAKQIGVTHHSPENDDATLDNRAAEFMDLIRDLGSDAQSFFVRQGQELKIERKDDSEDAVHRNASLVLQMVSELHQLGYERLRISPGMSPNGTHWRCAVTHVANIKSGHGALVVDQSNDVVTYSSGAGDQFFGWDDAGQDSADALARKFIERFPVITRLGRGDDEEYVEWYEQVVELVAQGDLPCAYSDWSDDEKDGILPTVGGVGELPMPPEGEG